MKIRELKEAEVTFSLRIEPECEPIEGNCSAIDEETDREQEAWVRDQLNAGNEWAWCTVFVTARWGDFEGRDSLGCCSYESRDDFERGGYFEDMKAVALDNLRASIERAAAQIAPLVEPSDQQIRESCVCVRNEPLCPYGATCGPR